MAKVRYRSARVVVHQHVQKVAGRGWGGGRSDHDPEDRASTGAKLAGAFRDPSDPRWHPFRGNQLLTASELERAYEDSADVRGTFNQLQRRISTWDHRWVPNVPEDDPRYAFAVVQADACTKWFDEHTLNTEGHNWQTFWGLVVHDALTYWHGVFEHRYRQVVGADGKKKQGTLIEFLPLYGGAVHPVPRKDEPRRLAGWVEDISDRAPANAQPQDTVRRIPKGKVTSLRLDPTTSSLYSKPLIETAVRQIGALMRQSLRYFEELGSELPPGFLVLTGKRSPEFDKVATEKRGRHKGKDSEMRVIHSTGAATEPKWVRLERAWRELELLPLAEDARRVWWRLCGVTPADMGEVEDANRSNMDAQLETGSSHLIDPLLEGIQSIVNDSMIPPVLKMLFQRDDVPVLVKFEFDRDTKLSPEEQDDLESARDKQVRNGTRSPNELRAEDGLEPYDGGSTFYRDQQELGSLGNDDDGEEPDGNDPEDGPDDDGGDDPDGGDDRAAVRASVPEFQVPDLEEIRQQLRNATEIPNEPDTAAASPVTVRDRAAALIANLGYAQRNGLDQVRAIDGPDALRWNPLPLTLPERGRSPSQLPSGWQDDGAFADHRTVDLSRLHDVVVEYGERVQDLWDVTLAQVLAATAGAHSRGEARSPTHGRALDAAIESMVARWRDATGELYTFAAVDARDAVRDFTGEDEIGTEAADLAAQFATVAAGYLVNLTTELRTRIDRALELLESDPENLDAVLSEIERSWDAQEHRIDNWSGRLVQLSNQAAVATLLQAAALVVDGEITRDDPWVALWVDLKDDNECETCLDEGEQGWRLLAQLTTVPGGDTQCGGRCRCVLVFARRSEVDSGAVTAP